MHKIVTFKHERRNVPLTIPEEANYYENTYTVIVGKNGVGKSRLLSHMVNEYVTMSTLPFGRSYEEHINLDIEEESRVIAVSTSPFDKFKLPPNIKVSRDQVVTTNYRYIGMRSGGPYGASAISLISSATKGILNRFLNKNNNDRLSDVFNSLGFSPQVQLIFKPNFISSIDVDSYKYASTQFDFDKENDLSINWLNEIGVSTGSRLYESLSVLNDNEKKIIAKSLIALNEVIHYERYVSVVLDFNHGGFFSLNNNKYRDVNILEALEVLVNFDLVRLMDMKLYKEDFGDMSLRRASSGEQCMLVIMLGIAGHITDNSLIFIDEPEISLHPKWQEEFMSLLIRTFSKYKSCQFFIATHSPQMVSRLIEKNCFVTSLTKNEVYSASLFYNMSSDFQLAELFEAPGTKNEYITRLAFSLLSKVKKNKTVSSSDCVELDKLMKLIQSVDDNDPTIELVSSIREVVLHYASVK